MLHLYYGNRMEELLDALLGQQAASLQKPIDSPCMLLPFIVPNDAIAALVRLSLTRMAGEATSMQSFSLPQFVAHLLAATPVRLLSAAVLQRFLFAVLRNEEGLHHPLLEPVRSYLQQTGGAPSMPERRCWQFAGDVARLLEEYSLTRPATLRAWEDHASAANAQTAFAWQRQLWQQLRGVSGLCQRSTEQTGLAWLAWSEVGDWLRQHRIALPPRLYVVGFSYLAESHQYLLARLAEGCDVHVLFGYPCPADDWRPGHDDSRETPALRLWGRPGRDSLRLLRSRTACTVTVWECDPLVAGETILRRLQHDIVYRYPSENVEASDTADGSVRFLECPGLRREVEIVADTIWTLISRTSQEPQPLCFSDIAVLVPPAQQQAYQAHIAAVFAACHAIPHRMLDSSPAALSRVVDAILQLLALPLGSFSRRDVLRFVTHPAVRCRYPEADTARWLQWCDDLEILYGIDHQDHADTSIEQEVFHWEQGLRRLLLGAFFGSEYDAVQQVFTLGEDAYLPYDLPADQLDNMALLLRLVRSLMHDVRYARTAQLSLPQWGQFLECLVQAYIDAPDDEEAGVLTQCLEALADLEPSDWQGPPMSYQTAVDWARRALQEMPARPASCVPSGVTVATWIPMRSLPFRVVCVLGLGEQHFPTAARHDPLDMQLASRQPGDVSRREQDLYMFLETLLSTRDCLVLSYVCQDASSGEPLPASSLWYDLRAMLTPRYLSAAALEACTVRHPVQHHDPRYFPELFPAVTDPLATVLPVAHTAARTVALRQHLQHWCAEHRQPFPDLRALLAHTAPQQRLALQAWLGLTDLPAPPSLVGSQEQPVTISLETLHQFLLCPLQAWGRWVLRLREATEDDLLAEEDEPVATASLVTAALLREVFLAAWQSTAIPPTQQTWETLYAERARWLELAGKTPVGVIRQVERQRHLALLRQWNGRVQAAWGEVPADLQVRRFGQGRIDERVQARHPALQLAISLPDSTAPTQVELSGRTEILSPTVPGSLRLLLRRQANRKDVLRGFLDYVVLTASQCLPGTSYQSLVVARESSQQVTFASLTPEMARQYLTTLIGDFLGQGHAYLLPVEAVLDYDPEAPAKPFAEVVQECLATQQYSSRYGPVPYPEDYPPPAEALAQAMIARRFGLFRRLCQA